MRHKKHTIESLYALTLWELDIDVDRANNFQGYGHLIDGAYPMINTMLKRIPSA